MFFTINEFCYLYTHAVLKLYTLQDYFGTLLKAENRLCQLTWSYYVCIWRVTAWGGEERVGGFFAQTNVQ